jgi:hypothetical protein
VERIGERRATISCLALDGRTASLWVREGRLCDAEAEGHTGSRALIRALALVEGSFEVRIEPHEVPEKFEQPAIDVLSEHQEKADLWHQYVEALHGLDALYEVSLSAVARKLGEIPDAANLVLRQVDGTRRVRSLLEAAPFEDELETLRLLLQLKSLEVIARTEVTPPASWVPVDEANFPLVEASPLPGIPVDWAESTRPSLTIPVYRFLPAHGARKLRMEEEQAALLEKLAAAGDRPVLLTHEVLAPGAVIPENFNETFFQMASAAQESNRLEAESDRRRKLMVIVLVALVGGVSAGLLLWRWLGVRA